MQVFLGHCLRNEQIIDISYQTLNDPKINQESCQEVSKIVENSPLLELSYGKAGNSDDGSAPKDRADVLHH